MIKLKVGAVFISDVHYSKNYRKEAFEDFLAEMEKKLPPQIIFFGDVFELLFGKVDYTISQNIQIISKINNLAKKIEIIYLEGNHDFNLKNIFQNILIIPNHRQPVKTVFDDEVFLLAHGDIYISKSFAIYRRLIQSTFILTIFNIFDKLIGNLIIKKLDLLQKKKAKCFKAFQFEKVAKNRIDIFLNNYNNFNYIVEGHFHQNYKITYKNINYLNLPAFGCNKKYYILENSLKKL